MEIYTPCPNCKQETVTRTIYKDRVTLARKKGNTLTVTCQFCGNLFKAHVDDFKAQKSTLNYVVIGLLVVVSAGLAFFPVILALHTGFYIITTLPFVVYYIYQQQLKEKIRGFNRHYLSNRRF